MSITSHPPEAEGVFLIDFDQTIHPWGTQMFHYEAPYEGASEFTKKLRGRGYTIGIFTSRLSPFWLSAVGHTAQDHITYITEYANQYGIEFDFITAEKVPALAYIDDKAITFRGDWNDIHRQFVQEGWL